MASTGWLPAGAAASSDFVNVSSALTSDNNRATKTWASGEIGITAYGFTGLSIPANSIINGIEIRAEGLITGGDGDSYTYAYLVKADTYTPKSTSSKAIPFTGTESQVTLGNSTDLWGGCDTDGNDVINRAWASTDFTSQFGVELRWYCDTSSTVNVDSIFLQVHYTPGASKPLLAGLTQAEVHTPRIIRSRKAASSYAQAETFVAIPRADRARPVIGTFAQAQAYASVPVTMARRMTPVITQVETIIPVLARTAVITGAISEVQAYVIDLIIPTELLAVIAQAQGYVTEGLFKTADLAPVIAQIEEVITAVIREMYLVLPVEQVQEIIATLGEIFFFDAIIDQAQTNTGDIIRRQRMLPEVLAQVQDFVSPALKRARITSAGFVQAQSFADVAFLRARTTVLSFAQQESVSSALRRAQRVLTSWAQAETFSTVPVTRARKVSTPITEAEVFASVLTMARPVTVTNTQVEVITPVLSREQRYLVLYEEHQDTLGGINLGRQVIVPITEQETLTSVVRRNRRVILPISQAITHPDLAADRNRGILLPVTIQEILTPALARDRSALFSITQQEAFYQALARGKPLTSGFDLVSQVYGGLGIATTIGILIAQVEELNGLIGITYVLEAPINLAEDVNAHLGTVYTGPPAEDNIADIIIDQGATVDLTFSISANGTFSDLTGWSARAQVRQTFETTALITASTSNGKILWVDRQAGQFRLHLDETDTSYAGNPMLVFGKEDESLECVYDIELVSPINTIYKISRGTLTINREVTR